MKKTVNFMLTLILCVVTFNLIMVSNAEAKINFISIHGIGAYGAANRMGAVDSFKKGGYNKSKGTEWYSCKVGLAPELPYDTIITADKSGYVKAISFYYLDKDKKAVYPKIKKCIMNLYGDIDKAMADVEQMEKCLTNVMVNGKVSYFKSQFDNCYYHFHIEPAADNRFVRVIITCFQII